VDECGVVVYVWMLALLLDLLCICLRVWGRCGRFCASILRFLFAVTLVIFGFAFGF